jgi:hypothetical protein
MNRAELARFQRLIKHTPSGCWEWTGTGTPDGYGHFQPGPGQKRWMAHKWSYTAHNGPIPDGMQVDHKCHTDDTSCPGGSSCPHRRCVNPSHLEVVTASENTMRQRHYSRSRTECPRGHPYEGGNLIVGADGKRRCRECDRQRKRLPSQASH